MVIAKVLYWLCGVLVMALFVCVNYAKRQKANAKRYKVQLDENNRMIAGLTRTINELRKEEYIKCENKKEADEKIAEIKGDDALNGLCEHG